MMYKSPLRLSDISFIEAMWAVFNGERAAPSNWEHGYIELERLTNSIMKFTPDGKATLYKPKKKHLMVKWRIVSPTHNSSRGGYRRDDFRAHLSSGGMDRFSR